ncbi:alpha/beta fold hydrolase [Kitasatospora sp. LaBMicrA B282]|uniref:alpha/beta fold hydrolase n=1 Tax=Kitasatospora sp. LaBMicrA B282 TaxID=3420949 RepID=UPI003D1146B0
MTPSRIGTLPVPGATLHYELSGSGPLLLLISGGAADAGLYAGMVEPLAARHTVIRYDPRGLSRSRLDGPLTDQQVSVWSEDARRLLDHLTPAGAAGAETAAAVFGSSSGAIVALDLLARHPHRLRRVIAHEPPLVELLADPTPHRALFAEVRATFHAQGVAAAMGRLSTGLGGRPAERATELAPEIREMAPRMHANLPVFLAHVLGPFTASTPDLAALRPAAAKLVLATGRDSREQPALYGPAARLAELLGAAHLEFPGGHVGCTEHPHEFAARLLTALA